LNKTLTTAWKFEIMPGKNNHKKINPSYQVYAPKDIKIPIKLGGGVLKEYVVRQSPTKEVIRYSVAYINHAIFTGDNGRVLGYDNSHGGPHRHFMGKISLDKFENYEALYEHFEKEWQEIAKRFINGE
jgi:hypothetical protein